MKRYKFVGKGLGVPGLPHEITDEQAKAAGLADLLKAAVAAGNYQEIKEPGKPAEVKDGK